MRPANGHQHECQIHSRMLPEMAGRRPGIANLRVARAVLLRPRMTNKLSKHMTWLFAFGSIAAGIGSSYALAGAGQKVVAAVYFAIVAIGGFGATYLTKAKLGGAIASFLVGAGAAAVVYFSLVASLFAGSGLDK